MTQATTELPKQYDHGAAEKKWYAWWEQQGYFHAEPDATRQPYCVVIPPPNVTGALHLGHALNNTLQDILVRWKRMQGFNTLWMPGTDHAGIATQAVVERRILMTEKKSRHDLGRDALVARIWDWKQEYEARILGQLKRLGSSCDWQRTRFTLDPMCARAVRHTFYSFFKEKLIFRGKRLVNWDTFLQTAVSDDEVYHEKVAGNFWHFRYPVIDPGPGDPAYVIIATTRPETMLGDTAVAVHPDPAQALADYESELLAKLAASGEKAQPEIEAQLADVAMRKTTLLPQLIRLKEMAAAGKQLRLPLANRPIPLVADAWAKPELGSGCVKITPAHDPNDYEVGLRQNLPRINILERDGRLNEQAGAYQGLFIKQAREKVVADMEAQGLVEAIEEREIDLAHSDRSKTPIEPLLTDQWFVRMHELAQSAMDAVSSGRVKIIPERYASGYLAWLGEKRDWPISRQLWWGHRIPIWYCKTATENELAQAFKNRPDVCWHRDDAFGQWLICSQEADLPEDAIPGHALEQDPDVLDTWFSSALWTHSTLGWPDNTPELRHFYPTSALVTSRDIITLWVARMVLAGLHNLGEVPFREVYIHPKILDGYGEGMSKSKGNGVDPIDIMDTFGADALRFGLAYLATETQDLRMPVQFECPHCQALVEQTKKNRQLPRVDCTQCHQPFGTQWSETPADRALRKGAVVSERFEVARNFCNKLWNAARFALLNLEGYTAATVSAGDLAVEDHWLLSRLETVRGQVTQQLAEYRFADAARTLYEFAWDDFCSFYVEMVKTRLADGPARATAQRVLAYSLDALLRLLHPFVPFVTEEVWQLLGQMAEPRGLTQLQPSAASIVIAPWPDKLGTADPAIEERFSLFQQLLKGLREVRSRQNIAPRATMNFCVIAEDASTQLLRPMEPYFKSMANAQATAWGSFGTPPETSTSFQFSNVTVHVDLAGHIDLGAELKKQEKELEKLLGMQAAKERKLGSADFVARAPADVVEKERASLAELVAKIATLSATVSKLRGK